MILSNKEIKQAIDYGRWKYKSLLSRPPKIGINSLDITLSPYTARLNLDKVPLIPGANATRKQLDLDRLELKESDYIFERSTFTIRVKSNDTVLLGSAAESIDCTEPLMIDGKKRYFVQHYEGRSTLGRLGIMSHVTAGFGDYGFTGAFTLELVNVNSYDVLIPVGARIGQIYFTEISEPEGVYEGYTQHDFKPQIPRLGLGRL